MRNLLQAKTVNKYDGFTIQVTNDEVFTRMGTEKGLLYSVKKRKLQYFRHVLRNEKYRLLQLIAQGRIEGKRAPGRRRTS
jgi:hypothetical protein